MDIGIFENDAADQNVEVAGKQKDRRTARLLIGGGLLVGAIIGALITTFGVGIKPRPEPGIEGTWDLATLGEQPVSASSTAGILFQRVTFRAGKLSGQSVVRPVSDTGQVRLPFPDESVDSVTTTADDPNIHVQWSGTYQIDDHRQATIHVGKAVYFAKVELFPGGQTMQFNQDVVLTLPGIGKYRRYISSAQTPVNRTAPPTPGQL